MTTNNEKVLEFYEAFQQGEFKGDISNPSLQEDVFPAERLDLKVGLIAEEFFELVEAVYNKESAEHLQNAWQHIFKVSLTEPRTLDIVEAADATTDLRYVIEGFDIEAGIPSDLVFNEVHLSNLSKLDNDGNPLISDGVTPAHDGKVKPKGKITKSDNYFDPDLKAILAGRTPNRAPKVKA